MLMHRGIIRTMKTRGNQQGFIAIFSVLIIMGILTILVIGFSNITRQAQRRTLDDQLNTQAFYAAETGVNRAQTILNSGELSSKEECTNLPNEYDYNIDSDLGITISCLLINPTPTSLEYSSIPTPGQGQPLVTLLRSDSGDPITSIDVSWDTSDVGDLGNPATVPTTGLSGGNPVLPSAAAWGDRIGVLRVDMVRIPSSFNATHLARDYMVSNLYSFFLYPSTAASSNTFTIAPGAVNAGQTMQVQCATATAELYRCTGNMSLSGSTSDMYYVRLTSYYRSSRLGLVAYNGNSELELTGAQAVVDATGRVADVSRRIQVRLPIRSALNSFPGYHESAAILSASSICKLLIGVPGASEVHGLGASDAACSL